MSENRGRCGQCINMISAEASSRRMHEMGYRNCTFKQSWQFIHAAMLCNMEPLKFKKRDGEKLK